MEFIRYSQILAFLSVLVVASDAAFPPEVYWNSKLPNSAMPKSIKDLLQPSVPVVIARPGGGGRSVGGVPVGVGVVTAKFGGGGTSVGVGKGGVGVVTKKPGGGGTAVGVGKGGVGVSTGKPGGGRTNVGVGKGGVDVGTRTKKGRPIYVGVHPGSNPFFYNYAASETQLHQNPNLAVFFLTKDIVPGKKMKLNFFKTENPATFLPRKVADSIPFSSGKLPEIFSQFSVNHISEEAEIMKNTIKECEEKTNIKGEENFCATSLESMIDFSRTKIGKNVEAVSTEVEIGAAIKDYSIVAVKKISSGKSSVSCHRQEYAYAVFYCHSTVSTEVYKVSLKSSDGSKVEAVAVCHLDTAAWNPKHLAFHLLKVKPGSVPVCHFLPQDHVVWIPKN